jgi:sugar lactone lactonase YvrE
VAIDCDTGLPTGAWSDFASIEDGGSPDGAVIDSEGFMWNARWGAGSVVRIAPDGTLDRVVKVPGASQVTCPSLGGKDLKTLFITTARENMTDEQLATEPNSGSVFAIEVDVPGQPEHLAKL